MSIHLRVGHASLTCLLLFAVSAVAGPPSDTLLPNTTKGYVSVAHPGEFKDRWLKTQWGQLANDEVMQPFVDDLKKQIQDEYSVVEDKLGFTFEELDGVSSGELSLSIIEGKGRDAALAVTIDITGHKQQADQLLAGIEKRFAGRGGKKQTAEVGGTTVQIFTIPTDVKDKPQTTVYFVQDDLLCGVDDRELAEAILKRFPGNAKDNLASVAAYQAVMQQCAKEAKELKPEARWFVEPFGLVYAARSLEKNKRPPSRDQDFVKILQNTGFDAVKGIGGYVNQLVDEQVEFMHRTCAYAPAVDPKDPLRWTKSMRMLQLPNVAAFEPQSFVPRNSAGYRTISLNVADAFDNIGPLVNALKEHEDAWENSLDGWKNDPFGPKVDVRNEIIAHLGNRITLFTNYDVPVSTESERSLIAIDTTNEKALAESLRKWMDREPDVQRREIGQYVVWERVPPTIDEELGNDIPGFTPLGGTDAGGKGDKDGEAVLPNSAITVAFGHLMMASDINYLADILQGFGQRDRLASSADYKQVVGVLDKHMSGERSVLEFGRSDEELRPIFELVRQNRMPESKSILGKILNRILTTEKEREGGVLRKQTIDGGSLPNFEAVRRYFGPHGGLIRSNPDGWVMTGVVLNTEAP